MNKKDYYEILGVSKTATDEEIKSAFRKLAKENHPDISKEANAEAKFKEIGEAYAVLSDPVKRKNYDNYGNADFGSSAGGFSGFDPGEIDLEEILRSAFGSFGGFGGFSGFDGFSSFGKRNTRGEDILVKLDLTFEEAVFGTEKEIKVILDEVCDACNGAGGFNSKTCSMCGGHGRVLERMGFFQTERTCPTCNGSGIEFEKMCTSCGGSGIKQVEKKKKIVIPKGVDSDTKLRLRNQGNSSKDGIRGDIYIKFNIKPHKIFERVDNDIYLEVPITFPEAALGVKKEIPTLYGNVFLNIKAGTQNYTRLKLKEKGVSYLNSTRVGDMYAVINIITPRKLTKEEKNLFLNLEKATLDKEKEFDEFKKFL